jgi:PAS domain S-box-containing protein
MIMDAQASPDPNGAETTRREMGDALAAIVYSALPDLRLDFANRYALEYLGVVSEDVADYSWIDYIHPDDRDSVLTAWEASRATGQPYRHEHRLRMSDGQYRRFLAEALPLRGESGDVVKWYGVLTPLDGPRLRGPRPRPAKIDYYPLRDASGRLLLVEVTTWDEQPFDPAAKRHTCGMWYRVSFVEGAE